MLYHRVPRGALPIHFFIHFCCRKMLNVITIKVSRMTSHCASTVQMREESESGIRMSNVNVNVKSKFI